SDRPEAVVAGETAAEPRLEPAFLQVDIVVDEERLLGRELEEAGCGADRPPRLVHVRLRLEEGEPTVADAQLGEPAGELRAERAAVAPRQLVGDEPADVVPRPLVLAARVAEAHDEQVERRGGLAS